MKKVIYYWSPCLTNVGTIKSTLNSCIALAKYNIEFDVVLLNVFGEWTEHKKYLSDRGVKVKDLAFDYLKFLPKYGFLQSRFTYILVSLISFFPLFFLLKKNSPNYLIAHLITSLPLLLFNIFNFNTKLILRISGYPVLNFVRRKFWSFSCDKIFHITCPTDELMDDIISLKLFKKNKISILSDAILNIDDYKKKIIENFNSYNFKLPHDYFLSIGRFTKQKNYTYLIKEFKLFCKKFSDQKLLIIGNGELKDNIKKQINKLQLNNNVFLLDYTSNVFYYMKRAKAFILSSLWEEVGFVIVESAMSNTIVISSNCKNGPKEFLSRGEGGFLFNSNENEALSKSLELFINSNKQNVYKKKIVAKKNCLKFTMFRHQVELKKILS